MVDITKTIQSELKGITNVSSGSWDKSSTFSVGDRLAGLVMVDISPEATNTPGSEIRVEVSQKDTGDDTWVVYTSFVTTTSTVNSNAVDGTEAAGETVIGETTTTGLAVNQIIFFKNSTIANSEWAQMVSFIGSTSFTLLDGLTNAQTGSTWYNRGERFAIPVDFTTVTRMRVVLNNNYGSSPVAVNWRVALITADAIA